MWIWFTFKTDTFNEKAGSCPLYRSPFCIHHNLWFINLILESLPCFSIKTFRECHILNVHSKTLRWYLWPLNSFESLTLNHPDDRIYTRTICKFKRPSIRPICFGILFFCLLMASADDFSLWMPLKLKEILLDQMIIRRFASIASYLVYPQRSRALMEYEDYVWTSES